MSAFPFYQQLDAMDCGPVVPERRRRACLQMVAKHYGKFYPLPWLRRASHLTREGVSLKGIATAAEQIGLRTLAVKIPFRSAKGLPSLVQAPLPAVIHWKNQHFLLAYKITRKLVYVADPARGKFKLSIAEFERAWKGDAEEGIAMIIEPTAQFYEEEPPESGRLRLSFLTNYLRPYGKLGVQLLLGLILSSLLALAFPFLTQAIVDTGIQNQDIGFIYLVLIGQLVIYLTSTAVRFVQNWILLHIGIRMNVALISDFLTKLMRLPIGFFDAKMTGDLLQRIGDHQRIENFLTRSTLSVVLSVFNLFVFGLVLLYYSTTIFAIFIGASVLYFAWIYLFLKKRKEIDYRAFQQQSNNQDSLLEIIQGMQEIKLQGSQLKRRWRWAEIQAKLFRVQMSALSLEQVQEAGALFINQTKDILITVIAATAVIRGEVTLGMMLAIQYIIGQLNGPLQQMIGFVQAGQNAKISAERLSEIHAQEDEGTDSEAIAPTWETDIDIQGVSFRYTDISDDVLTDIDLQIPHGKVTAIVGTSGSGKTTLLKLLLGFYTPTRGKITVGGTDLRHLDQQAWRDGCGVVMQDGFLFSDPISDNVSESDDTTDPVRLARAIHTANIEDFIQELPLGLKTTIGARGNGVSQGQRQRLLIARAVYKDPKVLLFDEATNALDANNERIIIDRLDTFFRGRSVVVVAHRLSTVSHADNIVVLERGRVVETGSHHDLVNKRGAYYTLVKNQLELGN